MIAYVEIPSLQKNRISKFSKIAGYKKNIQKIELHFYILAMNTWRTESPRWYGSVVECQPANQRITSSIPIQGTCLSCRPGPQEGSCERQPHTDVSLPLFFPPFPLSKKK